MLLECLIKREGPTPVTIDKYDYLFTSRPELTNGDKTAQVCHVNSTDHCDRLISTGNYRLYQAKAVESHGDDAKRLTKETFATIKNAPSLKSLIMNCDDKDLLQALIEEEARSAKPREWAGESLAKRLDELEGK